MVKVNIFEDSNGASNEVTDNGAKAESRAASPYGEGAPKTPVHVAEVMLAEDDDFVIPSLLDDYEEELRAVVKGLDGLAVNSARTIPVQIASGETLDVDEDVIETFGVVEDLLELGLFSEDVPIPLPGCESMEHLSKIVNFCAAQLRGDPAKAVPAAVKAKDEMDSREKQDRLDAIPEALLEDFPTSVARECMMLAFYLRIPAAEDALTLINARHLSLMSIREMREYLGAEDDLSLEEKKELFERNKWALSKEDKEFVLAEIAEMEEARAKASDDDEVEGDLEAVIAATAKVTLDEALADCEASLECSG